jgi:hypothetical protein
MKPIGRARIASSRCRPEGWSVTGDGFDPDHRIHLSKNPANRAGLHLTPQEQKRNIISLATSHRE